MRFDTSEMKTLTSCARKWQLSSRNAFHMRPKLTNPNLFFGTIFHECLHALYLGGDVDKIVAQAVKECQGDPTQQKVIEAMIRGYASEVLPTDLDTYKVKDIEHGVNFKLCDIIDEVTGEVEEVTVCGSIDMIVIREDTRTVYGFEHKSAAKFRPNIYIALDEQPRVYFIALMHYVDELNANLKEGEQPYTVGGIFINEVKKVQKKFEYSRHLCSYGPAQIEGFKNKLIRAAQKIYRATKGYTSCDMEPSYMGCQMCDFAPICETYGYAAIDKEELLEEFAEEFEVRDVDHLDEKVERRIEG